MFADDLENRFRGMFSKPKLAEKLVEDHMRARQPPEAAKQRREPDERPSNVRKRHIMRQWPRAPDGELIRSTPPGKVAGNNQELWGATVFDFFFVKRDPQIPGWMTISTGSKIGAWMKEHGELEAAKDELQWVKDEAEPREIFPCDMAILIRDQDYRPAVVTELFDQKFTKDGRLSAKRYNKFQNRLPFHLLPEKLLVHDPDDTLNVGSGGTRAAEERSAPRVYRLKLTSETQAAVAAEREKLARDAAESQSKVQGRVYTTPLEEILSGKAKEGLVDEATFAVFPPAPPAPLSTPEAHLYINSTDLLGTGNHSHVYRAAWEIPRSLVVEPRLCDWCIEQALNVKLKEDAPDVDLDEELPIDEQNDILMKAIASKSGKQAKITIEERTRPGVEVEVVSGHDNTKQNVVFDEGGQEFRRCYEGSVRKVPIDVKWTTPGNYCIHEAARLNKDSTTFKVSVSAKLSIARDEHLAREARNYQKFPAHFFQHWSGYNVIEPLHDPTPALAVVPQFYGYYVPEDGEAKGGRYLSPILLLEDCGLPVDVDDLDLDDRHECASLLFRMHCEGWLHNSFYPRNILLQHGDIEEWPIGRDMEDRRFRLIDFGRSEYYPSGNDFARLRSAEEMKCQQMFKIINH